MSNTKTRRMVVFLAAVCLAVAVCLCGTGCCLRNAWSIGERTVTLDDRYFEYSEDGSEFIYTCSKKTERSLPFFTTHDTYEPVSLRFQLASARKDMIPVILEKEPYSTYSHLQHKSKDGTKTANCFQVADLIRDEKIVDSETISAKTGVRSGDTIRLRIAPEDYHVLSEPCLFELGYPKMDNQLTTGYDFGYYYCLVFPQQESVDGDRLEMLAYPTVSAFDETVQKDVITETKELRDSYDPLWYGACALMTPVALVGDVLLLPYYIVHFYFGALSGGHSPI